LRALRLAPILLAGVSCLAFLPALTGEFVHWDDDVNLVANPHFRGLGWAQLRWMFTATLLGHWIPLTWLTFGLNYVLGGMDPWGYHLGNILLHGVNVVLVYAVSRRLLAAGFSTAVTVDSLSPLGRGQGEGQSAGEGRLAIEAGAAVAALLFAVHPLRVESVAWATERRDVLCSAFYLLAVHAYLRGAARGGTVRGRWLVASLAAFAAALMSKAMAMTLPASLLLLDVYPLRRWQALGWRAAFREKLPFLVLSAASAAVALLALSKGSPPTGYESYGPGARVAMVGYSLWFYPWKLVWPHALSPLYELPPAIDPLEWRFLTPLLAVVAVTGALLAGRRRWPGGLAAWVHSAIILAPVSGVVHAGHQLAHDRYSYLSGLGLTLLAGAGVSWVLLAYGQGRLRVWAPVGVLAAGGITAVLLGAGTWRQTQIWHDSETLWRAAVSVEPSCAICRNNLGAALMEGRHPRDPRQVEAEAQLREAIRLRPHYADAYRSLSTLYSNQRRYGDAEQVVRAMIHQFPDLADGLTRLARLHAAQGRYPEAIALLRAALASGRESARVRIELGQVFNNHGIEHATAGRAAEAAALFEAAARLMPSDPTPLENLGRLLIEQGKAADAVVPLRRAVVLDPRSSPARFWLARAYLVTGQASLAALEIDALRGLDPARAAEVAKRH
jgi:Tfp pilus assembly protein PilF